MKSILSRFVVASAVAAVVALGSSSANAETLVKVPFSFTAGGKVCPAGSYIVRKDGSFVTLGHKGYSERFTWVVGPGVADPNDTKIALKFDEIGDTHVLQSVQYGPTITVRLDKKALHDSERQSALSGGR